MTRKVAIAGALIAGLSASAAAGQSSDDPVLVRQLAERALSGNFGGNVTLLPGKLVDTQPPLAIPPGWKLIGSISSSMVTPAAGTTLTNSAVFLDGQGTPDEAVAALKATLVAVGWKPFPVDNGFRGGGFVAPNQMATANLMLCGNDNTYANIGASTVAGSNAPVRAQISATTITGLGLGSPCASGSGRPLTTSVPPIPAVFAQLPRLTIPDGAVTISYGGGGGGQFSASSGLTIDKAPEVSELDRSFTQQLQTAGWRRISTAADGNLATTSVWRKTVDGTELQTVLTITAALGGEQRRDLSLVTTMPATANQTGPFATQAIAVAPPPFPVATTAVPVGPPPTISVPPKVTSKPTVTTRAPKKLKTTSKRR